MRARVRVLAPGVCKPQAKNRVCLHTPGPGAGCVQASSQTIAPWGAWRSDGLCIDVPCACTDGVHCFSRG